MKTTHLLTAISCTLLSISLAAAAADPAPVPAPANTPAPSAAAPASGNAPTPIAAAAPRAVSTPILAQADIPAARTTLETPPVPPQPTVYSQVAVVDFAKLAGELRWSEEIAQSSRKDREAAQTQLQQLQASLAKQYTDRKSQIADQFPQIKKDEFLKAPNEPALWEKLGVPKEQQQELSVAMQGAEKHVTQLQESFSKAISQRQVELTRQYRLMLQTPVRQVAEDQHYTVVLMIPSDNVLYASPMVDITNKVVDKIREQKAPPPTLPEMPLSPAPSLFGAPAVPPGAPPTAMPVR